MVSILVLLEIALEVRLHQSANFVFTSFQSLFYWKLLWKGQDPEPPYVTSFGFNPCSIGNCSGRQRLHLGRYARRGFQSLFYWKLLWKKKHRPILLSTQRRFNPCSIGNCSGSVTHKRMELVAYLFQSLFYWKLLWKFSKINYGNSNLNVSILVLLEIALEDSTSSTIFSFGFCFNPCSIGNCSGSFLILFQYQKTFCVSILVLLEIALEVFAGVVWKMARLCFNPCSIGNCSGSF